MYPSSLCCRTRAYLQVVQFKAHRSHILIEPAAQGAVTAQRPILQLGRFPRIKKKACSVKIAQWMCALHRQTAPTAFCTNEVMLFASHAALSPWFDFAHRMFFPFVSHSLTCLSHRSLLWQLFRFCRYSFDFTTLPSIAEAEEYQMSSLQVLVLTARKSGQFKFMSIL